MCCDIVDVFAITQERFYVSMLFGVLPTSVKNFQTSSKYSLKGERKSTQKMENKLLSLECWCALDIKSFVSRLLTFSL